VRRLVATDIEKRYSDTPQRHDSQHRPGSARITSHKLLSAGLGRWSNPHPRPYSRPHEAGSSRPWYPVRGRASAGVALLELRSRRQPADQVTHQGPCLAGAGVSYVSGAAPGHRGGVGKYLATQTAAPQMTQHSEAHCVRGCRSGPHTPLANGCGWRLAPEGEPAPSHSPEIGLVVLQSNAHRARRCAWPRTQCSLGSVVSP
jgi:hypothetical protein